MAMWVPAHFTGILIIVRILRWCFSLLGYKSREVTFLCLGINLPDRYVELVAVTIVEEVEESLSFLEVELAYLHLMSVQHRF